MLAFLGATSCDQVRDRAEEAREGVEAAVGSDGQTADEGPELADDGDVGDNALIYLRDDVPRLVIEVDAVEGKEPSDASLDHLRSVLASVLDKPGGIEVMPTEAIGGAEDRYSTGDLRAVEERRRDTSSDGESASLYVLVVTGEFADDPHALGVAYSASSMAIFRDTVEEASGFLGSPERVERSVIVHEAGHMLGLVNIGYSSPREREDPEHPNHSSNEDSVMFWAVESDAIFQLLDGPGPDNFDEDDRDDLEDLKSGQL